MPDKKLTVAEILKGLEHCKNDGDCFSCPLSGTVYCVNSTTVAKSFYDLINHQQAEIKRFELSNAMLTNKCDNKRQWIQHLEDEVRNLVFQHGPKGERGKNGMIATCPNCGRSHEDITWVADIDVCKCTCGWQSEPGECNYKKSSCYERELYGFAELMKQALPSWLHPVVDTVFHSFVKRA